MSKDHMALNTAFLLMAPYNGAAVIPVESVCRDYFSHLDLTKFIRRVNEGDIKIPMVRIEDSRKSAKGIHLQDLANYIDDRRNEEQKELKQVWG